MLSQSAALFFALAGVALSSPLRGRQAANDFSGTTQNGLQGILQGTQGTQGAPGQAAANCPQKIVIFARGTTESGNVGTIAGPPFFQALAQQVGPQNLAVQGMDYPANVQGFLAGGDADGSQMMAQLTQQAVTQCPNSKVVMAGYSQGGQLVHNAAAMLPATVTGSLGGVVIFGDPDNGQAVQGVSAPKTKVICHQGDDICRGGSQVLQAHLTYGNDADTAAQFAASL